MDAPRSHPVMVHYTLLNRLSRFALVWCRLSRTKTTIRTASLEGFAGNSEVDANGIVRFQAFDSAIPVRFGRAAVACVPVQRRERLVLQLPARARRGAGSRVSEDLFCPGRFDGILAQARAQHSSPLLMTGRCLIRSSR